ncbi:MAG TPA: mechanosensitive ion channel domain-containing protein [Mucilaginibacter sp.]|nr:mechanosensitive ion channel domain-containing protein [Mucilaginibacter sp.]
MKELVESWSGRIQPLVWDLIIFALAIILGLLVKLIIKAILNYHKEHKDYSLFRSILTHFSRPLNHFVPLLMLNLMEPLMELSPRYDLALSRTIQIALIISFATLLMNAMNVFEDYVYHTYSLDKEDNLKERKIRTQIQFIRKVLGTVVVFVTVAIILLSFDSVRKIGAGLLTGVGIGGIIIGFAAQKSLGNLLAGFQIAFTQPIRIDDVLIVEGEYGRVEEITLTYVVLSLWDQRRLILPINYFIEKPFQNWTRTSSELLGTVFLYLDYNTPVDAVREEFERLVQTSELWDKRVQGIQVTDAKMNCIELRVLVSARNSGQAFDLRCFIRENLIKFLKDNYPESLPLNRLVMKNMNPAQTEELPEKKADAQA